MCMTELSPLTATPTLGLVAGQFVAVSSVLQLKLCPRGGGGGGKFFCRWGHKIEQVGADLRKPKQKRFSRQIGLLNFKFSADLKKKKDHRAKLVYFSTSSLKLPQGKE